MFCREHVAQLRGIVEQLQARDVQLVVIGNGKPAQARRFRIERRLDDLTLFVDPGRRTYRAAGLRRGLGATFSGRTLKNAGRALTAGYRQGRVQGDPWQQGGTFVITADGRIPFAHVSQQAGDHASPADVLAALDRLA